MDVAVRRRGQREAPTARPEPASVPRQPGAGPPRRTARRLVRLALDLGVSPLAYYGLFLAGVATWRALLAATIVAGGWLVVTVAIDRRVDGLAAFMLGMYAVMFALAVATADERLLLARDPLTSGLAGLVFLASCLTATPATAYLARRLHDAAPDDARRQRYRHRVQSLVLGAGLVAEATVRLVLVSVGPIDVVAGLSPVIEFAVLPVLVLWMVAYRRRGRRADAREVTR